MSAPDGAVVPEGLRDVLTLAHYWQLHDGSGLCDEIIAERGYRSITAANDARQYGFKKDQVRAGLILPVHQPNGAAPSLFLLRPDNPRLSGRQGAHEIKYENPRGLGLQLDVPPRVQRHLPDPRLPLFATEGLKKGDALAQHSTAARPFAVLALPGVWGFRATNALGATTTQAQLREIAWSVRQTAEPRQVTVVFDSDVVTKGAVHKALLELTAVLKSYGAAVSFITLPAAAGQKVGVDDYLRTATIDDLFALRQVEVPQPTVAAPSVRLLASLPPKLDRPLRLVGERAYAAAWLPLETTTTEVWDKRTKAPRKVVPPEVSTSQELFIVRDDGALFGPDARPFSDLGCELRLDNPPLLDHHTWTVAGVMAHTRGQRVDGADLFGRLVAAYDAFLDFSASLAGQQAMCRLMACVSLSTWLLDAFDTAPYIYPTGGPGSGKTKLLELLAKTCYLGLMVTSGSSFPTLRDLADSGATLLIDDAEFLADQRKTDPHLRELILNGSRRTDAFIMHKEPAPGGSKAWLNVRSRTFSARGFSAIHLPDRVLGSRSIVVPLVKSLDKARGNRKVSRAEDWPCDLPQLQADLWAWALVTLPRAAPAWAEAADETTLLGRDLEPWQPLLAVAALVEAAGVGGVQADLAQVAASYGAERQELTFGSDLQHLIPQVLARLAAVEDRWVMPAPAARDSKDSGDSRDSNYVTPPLEELLSLRFEIPAGHVLQVTSREVATLIQRQQARDVGDFDVTDYSKEHWPNDSHTGQALTQMRLGRERKSSVRGRWREITPAELAIALIRYEVVSPPTDGDSNEAAVPDQGGHVFAVPPVPAVSAVPEQEQATPGGPNGRGDGPPDPSGELSSVTLGLDL